MIAMGGKGSVEPNPYVGCVIFNPENHRIISEGFHIQYGKEHAEVNAIRCGGALIKNSFLFVNLEPCCVWGKTPPCTDAIINAGIKRVYVGMMDPNPAVLGRGISTLREHSIEVIVEEHPPSMFLNRRFLCYWQKKRPYVILKWAQSINGVIGKSNERVFLTDKENYLIHRWRSEEMAILIGGNTLFTDNPYLNVRKWYGRSPLKCVITSRPPDRKFNISEGGEWCIITSNKEAEGAWRHNGATTFLTDKNMEIEGALSFLYSRSLLSVIVEGGSKTINAFIERGLWDEYRCFVVHKYVDGDIRAPELPAPPKIIKDLGGSTLMIGFADNYPWYHLSYL